MNRLFLALSATSAICCWNVGVASIADAFGTGAAPSFALAQEEDPFGDGAADSSSSADSDSDPFGDESSDSNASNAADAKNVSASAVVADSDDDDSAAPFGEETSNDPFAPSTIPGVETSSPAAAASDASNDGDVDAETTLDPAAEERAKYARPADVPDELKTEDDFYQTATPAERAILTPKPVAAPDFLTASIRIARVGRVAFAKMLIAQAVDAPEGTPEESAKALDALGPGRLTFFVGNPEVGEIGAQVVEKVQANAKKYWESETAIRDAIRRTDRGTDVERANALLDVRKGGNVAIALLIGDLRTGDSAARSTAKSLLKFFEIDATDALLATLRAVGDAELAPIVDALNETNDSRVGLELAARFYRGVSDSDAQAAFERALIARFGVVPSREDVAKQAFEKANGYFRRTELFRVVIDDETTLWSWDAAANAPVRKTFSVDDAYRAAAADWAQAVLSVSNADASAAPNGALDLAVVAIGERLLYSVGLDVGRDAVAAFDAALPNLTVAELVSGVDFALRTDRCKGAIVPTILLAARGDASLCYSTNGEPSVVVRAATSLDRRLRFEALSAIAAWNPDRSYLGSSRVVSALQQFATSTGERVAIVAAPKLTDAGRIGQFFTEQGFKVVVASTGRDLLLRAQSTADVEIVFATATVGAPDLRVVAQMLRSDVRTSDVPLLVGYSNEAESSSASAFVGAEPNAIVLPEPFDLASGAWAVQETFDAANPEQVSAEIRLNQAKSAAAALVELATTRPRLYDEAVDWNALLSRFLATPDFVDVGVRFASTLKTPFAQIALVELVGDVRFDVATRRRALTALQSQWSANGSLLRGPEIQKMYDRYNASEKEDVETQKTLSDMLDAFEVATAKK